jgi:phosphate transport system substrate-binding protein
MHDDFRRDAFLVGVLVCGLALGVAVVWRVTRSAPPAPSPAEPLPAQQVAIVPGAPRPRAKAGEPPESPPPRDDGTQRPVPPQGRPAAPPKVAPPDADDDDRAFGALASRRDADAGAPAPSAAAAGEVVVGDDARRPAAPAPAAGSLQTVTISPSGDPIHPTQVPAVPPAASVRSSSASRLRGCGATMPSVLYQRWIAKFAKDHPDIAIEYQPIGSSGGVKALLDGTTDFAGTDTPLTDAEIAKAGGADTIVEVPTCADGLVAVCNLPASVQPVRLTAEILAKIALGDVAYWNDARITDVNRKLVFLRLEITPVVRYDACRATALWTRWLSPSDLTFAVKIGSGTQVKWQTGQTGKGNEGVATIIEQTSGAVGYLESRFAAEKRLSCALLQNESGRFVACTQESITAAEAAAADGMSGHILAANLRSLPGDDVYPLSAFTYVVVRRDLRTCATKEEAQALADFLRWGVRDGQAVAKDLGFAPLPAEVEAKAETALASLTWRDESLASSR